MNGKPQRTVRQDAPLIGSDAVLDALGDATRRAILERLREGPKPVVDIARGLPVGRPAVSQHLKVLKKRAWSWTTPPEPAASTGSM